MGLTSVELLIDVTPMRISYSGNVIVYGYTDTPSAISFQLAFFDANVLIRHLYDVSSELHVVDSDTNRVGYS